MNVASSQKPTKSGGKWIVELSMVIAMVCAVWTLSGKGRETSKSASAAPVAAVPTMDAPRPPELPSEPQHVEDVFLPHVADYGDYAEATGGPMPMTRYNPVTVQLMACKRVGHHYRWFFRIVNTSGKPWKGQVRIWVIADEVGELGAEDYDTRKTLAPGEGQTCPWFETYTAPSVLPNGNIDSYGWAVPV
jgi:hypothetical protein